VRDSISSPVEISATTRKPESEIEITLLMLGNAIIAVTRSF